MVDSEGNRKYKNLSLLCHCILTLPHGNAEPKRGFSINKAILAVRGFSIKEDTLEALWLVKDFLILNGGGDEVELTKELRYECYFSQQKKIEEEEAARKKTEEELKQKKDEIKSLERE